MTSRIKLLIEYEGTDYVGWQKQKNGRSVQEEIEICLSQLFGVRITILVAGRTDSGVHALGQVAHFDLEKETIKVDRLGFALNSFLKKRKNKITILECKKVKKTFHSRFSAKKKTYLYKILNRKTKSYLQTNRSWFVPIEIDLNAMKRSSIYFLGKHDFNAFRSIDCQAAKSERSIESVKIKKNKELIEIRITGRSFLHNQVRIMIGTLLNVGKGYWEIDKVKEIILSKERKNAGPTAPPHGLYLEKIFY